MFANDWWKSTGFLAGAVPNLSPDSDPTRVASYVPRYYNHDAGEQWRPLAVGFFEVRPGHVETVGADQLKPEFVTQLDVPQQCMAACTLGGCSDPTTAVHAACVASGCCPTQPTFTAPPQWSSQLNYVSVDCTKGPEAYCASDLAHRQCNPSSLLTPATDPACPDAPVPWAGY